MIDTNIIPIDLSNIVNFKLNENNTAIIATITAPLPISIELNDNFSISSKKNIVLYTEDKLHLNPEYPNGDTVVFDDINRFNDSLLDIDNTLNIGHSCSIEKPSYTQLESELNTLKTNYENMGNAIERLEGLIHASNC